MSNFISDFRDGISAYGEAWDIIRARKLWGYMLLPGIFSLLFGGLVIYLAFIFSTDLKDLIVGWYPWDTARETVATIAAILSVILIAASGLMIYKYVVLILVSPFMSLLSETVENYLLGNKESIAFSLPRAIKETLRGIRVALRNLIREILLTLVLFIVGFIPVIGFISGPAIFVLQSYYAGFGNMDFTLERHFGVRESVSFVRSHRGLAVGNGAVFLLILMIPIIGLFMAPGLATVAGAVESVHRLDNNNHDLLVS